MHRTVIRLPAVVALALPALVLPLAAFLGPAIASEPLPTPSQTSAPHDMEGMTGTDDMQGMEGMDHGAGSADHTEHGAEPAEGAIGATARPRVAVLSTFAGVNGAVLISASVLRRRDRARHPRRQRGSTPPTTV
ncbi:hypothetical protein DDP54_13380 [Cellulomonas sp. WB94]|uniref:hypothetical protein n=1 Tax=Cellulomonas sp. WB94 TaxID=2173174 RepID=UPI000D56D082|nr:hypothetical protein [Cellulomonas sp. WB94]PVU83817.1 hypothetical protein DDP54_13380 [Cellulomonas sp. WB94]